MAYQTGTASSPEDLLSKIKTFVESIGWVTDYYGSDTQTGITAGYLADKLLCVHTAAGNYFSFLAYNSTGDIYTSGATGYSAGAIRNNQPGHSSGNFFATSTRCVTNGWALTNKVIGPYAAYYFFGGSDYLHVVIEVVTNRFVHMHIGVLEKAGPYTGGEYFTGTAWTYDMFYTAGLSYQNDPDNTFNRMPFDSVGADTYVNSWQGIRMDTDGTSGKWWRMGYDNDTQNPCYGFMRSNSIVNMLVNSTPNTFNGASVMPPSLIAGYRTLGGYAIYGTVKDLRPINMSLLSPKDILTLGTDEWMVFPIIRKGTTSEYEPCSGNFAIAYRKVV